jgi:hypothetical protein
MKEMKFNVPDGYRLEVVYDGILNPDRQDSVWHTFGDTYPVAVLSDMDGRRVRIHVNGEQRYCRFDNDTISVRDGGDIEEYLLVSTDEEFWRDCADDTILCENNSWYEVFEQGNWDNFSEPASTPQEAIDYAVHMLMEIQGREVNDSE